jgi:hypothetical protein
VKQKTFEESHWINLSKIYSKMLIARLTKWADENSILIDNQYGFQKSKSTHDCVLLHSKHYQWKRN